MVSPSILAAGLNMDKLSTTAVGTRLRGRSAVQTVGITGPWSNTAHPIYSGNLSWGNVNNEMNDSGTYVVIYGNGTAATPKNLVTGWEAVSYGAYNEPHMQMGTYHLWVEMATGKLRIKSSAPTADNDGTVVGSQ